ncbi:MAG: proline iminopeptidase-family hydrolase [Alphaproteobacteria bacterium]
MTEPQAEKTGTIDVEGGKVWYRENGGRHHGAVPVLCIHGGPGLSHEYMLPLADLADERRVIFYDQLDAGKADRPGDPANWRVERFVAEVDAVRRALDLEQVIIVGNSWGGTIAAEYAIGRPAGLAGLVLSSPLINAHRWIADNTAYRHQLPADVQAALDEHEAAGTTDSAAYQAAVDVFSGRHGCRMDPLPDYVLRAFDALNAECYGTMWGPSEFTATGILADYDCSKRLHRIEAPTLFTCGEFDEAAPHSCHEYAALVPGAAVTVIDDASHMAFAEKRDEYMALMRGFIARVD